MLRILRKWTDARRRRRQRRTEELAAITGRALACGYAVPGPGYSTCAGIIVARRQVARNGLKAYVCWLASGNDVQAVWLEGAWPALGDLIVASGSCGWGPHHDEWVFYVAPGDLWVVAPQAVRAWRSTRGALIPPPPPIHLGMPTR
jgi:hypothetical protein